MSVARLETSSFAVHMDQLQQPTSKCGVVEYSLHVRRNMEVVNFPRALLDQS